MIRRPPRSTLFPYTSSSDLTNTGTVIHKAGGALYVNAEGTILNMESGIYDFQEDGAIIAPGSGSTSTFINYGTRSEEHTSELQSHLNLVCRLLLEKKK